MSILFLIVPGFCTVNENGVQSEFPMPLRVVLDDTDAPMALLRMWATRTLEDGQTEPEAKQQPDADRERIKTSAARERFDIPQSTFHDLVKKSGIKRASHGMYYLSDIKKMAKDNGYFCP